MPTGLGGFHEGGRRMTTAVRALLVANLAVFILQAMSRPLAGNGVERLFALSSEGWIRHWYWQFATYMFLHGDVFHLLLNMLGLFLMGPEIERTFGTRPFLAVYGISGLLGGVGWLGLTYPQQGFCLGASGAIFGILGAFAVLFPRVEITMLVFFVLPVTMRAWVLVSTLALIQFLYLISPGTGGHIAYAAHLAGALAGAAYAYVALRPGPRTAPVREWIERTRAARETRAGEEVDRILDKITKEGIHSLSERERRLLTEASRRR